MPKSPYPPIFEAETINHDDVTVEFLRHTVCGPSLGSAYQVGQRAGFKPAEAARLVRDGHAVLVDDQKPK